MDENILHIWLVSETQLSSDISVIAENKFIK